MKKKRKTLTPEITRLRAQVEAMNREVDYMDEKAKWCRANGTQNFPSIAVELDHFVGRLRAASQASGGEG